MTSQAYPWDPGDYRRHSQSQQHWAEQLIEKLQLQGDELLLDIGCGDGRNTAELARRLPRGRVEGVDSSMAMIRFASERFPPSRWTNLRFEIADAQRLRYQAAFDVVFSNAALHWIVDHQPVLAGIARALRQGGRFLLQMGGKGNAGQILAVVEQVVAQPHWRRFFEAFTFPYGFYGPDEYRRWLVDAGLTPQRAELLPRDMVHDGTAGLAGWVRSAWQPYTQRIPVDRRNAFIDEIVDRYLAACPADEHGRVHVAMVRLEVQGLAA